jgi:ABC-type uncharacterized transport system involved in gliding motility auxiliary subunit
MNYISFRHYKRIDLTQNKIYSISEQTREIASAIDQPVSVYVFFPRTSRLFTYISYTLEEIRRANPLIEVEYIDIDRDLVRVQEFARKYKLSSEDYIVVTCSDNFRVLVLNDLAEFEYAGAFYEQQEPALKGFTGEQAVISALISVTSEETTTIYFTYGHGEKNIDDTSSKMGYESARNSLRHNNYQVKSILLAEATVIPADCRLLIIAGPQTPFTDHELDLLKVYIDAGKPLLIMLDPGESTGIENLLKNFDIVAGFDIVFDPVQCVPFASPAYLLSNVVAQHQITDPLKNMMGMFFIARSITTLPVYSEKIYSSVLVETSDKGWAEKHPDQEPIEFNPDIDIPGPIPIAQAVELQTEPFTRMVVFGDSDFLTNSQIVNLANNDLFIRAVTWLVHKKETVAIPTKTFDRETIAITSSQMRTISYIVVLFMPLTSLSIGIFVWVLRRKF